MLEADGILWATPVYFWSMTVPRMKIMKKMCDTLLKKLKTSDPLLDIAVELEQIALNDDYFIEHNLYPNVDFYSGLGFVMGAF